MRRLGRVIHLTPSKMAVVKAEKLPKIGDRVVNERKKPVGTVFDIIGPTSSPYVEVKPDLKDPERLVAHFLYVLPSPKHKRKMRKGRK
ncbi:MAG: H/ACA ribonucleoprotein complex subunit GAR1 [Candidatus Bathyarchaeia archaeon]